MNVASQMNTPWFYVGCAGWGISSASAARFPSEGSHLERYAQVFSAVEINTSFYRPHQPKTYARWAASVPEAFRFSIKIPRTITHELRLRETAGALQAFIDQVMWLGDKLGCLLLQLPPGLRLNPPVARDFFGMLRRLVGVPVVCEPRHASWFTAEAAALMREADIACVHAHPMPVPGGEPAGAEHTLYIRLHGAPRMYYSAYDEGFIDTVAMRVVEADQAKRRVWCIFDNTAEGAALPNALALMERLSLPS